MEEEEEPAALRGVAPLAGEGSGQGAPGCPGGRGPASHHRPGRAEIAPAGSAPDTRPYLTLADRAF